MPDISPAPMDSIPPLKARRVKFAYPTGTRRQHYVNDELVLSHLVAVLSAMFPEGEDFFIRSVRNYRDRVTDPQLAEAVKGFIAQEATHRHQHRLLNERLQDMGYPTARVDRHVKELLSLVEKIVPKKMSLAATAALEHYTATFAEILLTSQRAQALLGDSEVRTMLLWHALEESEHKAVAFDVYRTADGPEWMRILTMEIASAIFWAEVGLQTGRSLLRDPAAYNPVRLVRSLNDLRKSPFFSWKAVRRYNSYNRPGFHPNEWDARDVTARWAAELFGEDPATI
ncbi:metal-dependent hydrolase [Skermania sp. ID1734]|uniref:metal-dependent hydrolase n=1 Tax=Skermania sp. ID1734 TaxID=2597516 RepID=UPI00117D186A|nr:metal-dependent hydrolase [Skermania sp. ID1734]TSD93650.1 metal-dependent hydrolase [Skermania sp. ID1734]